MTLGGREAGAVNQFFPSVRIQLRTRMDLTMQMKSCVNLALMMRKQEAEDKLDAFS